MREDIKIWLEALESGNYKQTQEKLCDGESFCCLGVYAYVNNLYTKEGMKSLINEFGYESNSEYYYAKINSFIDDNVFKDEEGYTIDTEEMINWNDRGDTFKEIAARLRGAYALED